MTSPSDQHPPPGLEPAQEPVRLGKYTLLEPLGQGGMGSIWRVRLDGAGGFQKELVLKRILPELASRRHFIEMFIREAKLSSQLQHPNIVQIFELEQFDGECIIAMEYVKGWDLLKVLTHASRMKRTLPVEHALLITREVCKALDHAHTARSREGRPLEIVHLDVSPSNVLIGDGGAVKLTDFGVARARLEEDGDPTSRADNLRGKAAYMSPEQVSGKPVDHRSDIFSSGVVLYEMLTLKRLFRARTLAETLENVRHADLEPRLQRHGYIPAPVQDILRRSLERRASDRYQTAAEMADAVDNYLFEGRIRTDERKLWTFVRTLCRTSESVTGPVDNRKAVVQWGTSAQGNTGMSSSAARSTADARFSFRNDDGSRFGPVTYRGLVRLLSTRSISPDDLVSVDAGPWMRVEDVPILADLLRSVRLPDVTAPVEEGDVQPAALAQLLVRLVLDLGTGRLRVLREGVCKDLFVRRGKIVHIATNRKSELLGPYLLSRSIVSAADLDRAEKHSQTSDTPLGESLVALGMMTHMVLVDAIQGQLEQKLQEVFAWRQGRYGWYAGDRPGPGILPLEVEPLPAMTEAIRQHVTAREKERALSAYGELRFHLVEPPPFEVRRLGFKGPELRLLREIAGPPRTLREIVREAGRRPGEANVVVHLLYVLDLAGHLRHLDQPSGPGPRTAPRRR